MRKLLFTFVLLLSVRLACQAQTGDIAFASDSARTICLAHWDTDGDGRLSLREAAQVTSLNKNFYLQRHVGSFDELRFFTGLRSIGASAFSDCYDLASVTLPPSVETIGEAAFWSCISLRHIGLPPSLRRMDSSCFYHCERLEEVAVPAGVDTLPHRAFMWCTALRRVALAEGVGGIGTEAFSQCVALQEADLPATLRSIGPMAFMRCKRLRIVCCRSQQPPVLGADAFEPEVQRNAMLFVPAGAAKAYRQAPGWKLFKYISELF